MSDSQPVQTPPAGPAGGSPFDHLPLWLRDWRVFAFILLIMVLGGQGAGDAIRSMLGIQAPAAVTAQHTCCQALEARLQSIEVSLGRVLSYCRTRGVLPASTTGAASPSPSAREAGSMTAVGSVP